MPVLAKSLDELCRDGQLLTSSQGREVYAVTYEGIRAPMIVKRLSIPATQAMVSGLIYSGAVADEQAAQEYYSSEMDDLRKELSLLEPLRDHPHFLPYLDSQIKEKEDGVGYDVYLLTLRADTVRELMQKQSFTYRSALELGISASDALNALRQNGLLHLDLKPENLYYDADGRFRIGDLGIQQINELAFVSLPDRYISFCTPPELCDVLGTPNETADTYALGIILWTIFNGYIPPFGGDESQRQEGKTLAVARFSWPELTEILGKACAPKPEDRYASPEELKADLEKLLNHVPDELILPLPEPEPEPEPETEPVMFSESSEAAENPEPSAEASDTDASETEQPSEPAAEAESDDPTQPTEPQTAASEPEQEVDELPEEPDDPTANTSRFHAAFAAAYEDDDEFDDLTKDPSKVPSHGPLWIKILVPVLVLALLAAAAFAVVTYLRSRPYVIEQLNLRLEGADTLHVELSAPEEAPLSVNLTDSDGRILQSVPYTGSELIFDDLDAGTEYRVRLECGNEHPLQGITYGQTITPLPTQLLSFTATPLSPTEIQLDFVSTGYEPEHWNLTFSNAEGESQTSTFTGHSLVIEGLDAGQSYTFTITDAENQQVLGMDTVTCETETVVNLISFELDDSEHNELTVSWASSGNLAKSWYLTCSGSDGSYRAEEITDQSDKHNYTFTDLPAGISYEITLNCEGLTNPDDATRSIELPLCSITDLVAFATDSSTIQVSWSFIDGEQPERWQLNCTNVDTGETQVFSVPENSYDISGLLPDAEYRIELTAGNGLLVGGCDPVTAHTLEAAKFDDYKTSGVFLGFFSLPNKENWGLMDLTNSTNLFSTSGGMAFAVEVSYQVTNADKSVNTLYVIRDMDGKIADYSIGSLSWAGNSTKETHFGGFQHCPDKAGDYMLELYFNGELLTKKAFTVY